jgi:energy-coupling factor transporter ATP-binding protein EcfA2
MKLEVKDMFKSFLVRNFRAFRQLSIPRFARVNLILGKNAVGKTTLLEALWLYAAGMRQEAIYEILLQREEMIIEQDPDTREVEVDLQALLPHSTPGPPPEIRIGPMDQPSDQLIARFIWLERTQDSEGRSSVDEIDEEKVGTGTGEGEVYRALRISPPSQPPFYVRGRGPWSRPLRYARTRRTEPFPPFLRAGDVDEELIGRWWDSLTLTDAEARIISFLHLLAPVERVSLVESPKPYPGRVFFVRLNDVERPRPLKSLGDGVERAFRTAVALEYASRATRNARQLECFPTPATGTTTSSRILLVDEVESGIHYTAISRYWSFIFRLAREAGVQVFATTHSWDCLRGFADAVEEDQENDGLAIRLEKIEGKEQTGAVIVDRDDLPIVIREKVEVR